MKKIILITIVLATIYYLNPGYFSLSNTGAYDENGNPQVWIFTFNDCGKPCNNAISTLDERVNYTEFNVSEDSGMQQLKKVGKSNQFPLILIGSKRILNSERMTIISNLAEVMGDSVLTPSERHVMQGHFYEDGSPAVIMYGASWCGYCKKMREYFEKNNIQYTELDAEGNAQDAYNILRGTGFPLIYVGYQRINGANINQFEKVMRELNI
jgi:glutaredoxin